MGVVYTVFIGQKLLPRVTAGERPADLASTLGDLAHTYALPGELDRVRVRRGSPLTGHTLAQANLRREYGLSVLLADLDLELNAAGIHLVFAELKDPVQDKIVRYGLLSTLDYRHFFPTIEAAVAAFHCEEQP